MSLKMKKVVVSWFFSLFLVFATITGAQAYTNVLAFGDSLSDNSVADGVGVARMTDGKVWVEYLASDLNASLTDWAMSGATTSLDAPELSDYGYDGTKYGLQWQVGAYAATYGSIADDTLITITAGGNDMFQGRDALTAAQNIAGTISYLIGKGGNSFMVMNLALSQQTDEYKAWMTAFNYYLAQYLAGLSTANTAVDIYLLDISDFVADADYYDITFVDNYETCLNNPNDPSCLTDGTFAWYDEVGVHPSTAAHRQIADLAKATLNPPTQTPEPASLLMLILGFAGLVGLRRRMK